MWYIVEMNLLQGNMGSLLLKYINFDAIMDTC